jgi:hypothetical protein
MKVFISHASADKPTVKAIAQALTDSGVKVWLDEADIRVGESIAEGITSGLVSSDLLLLAFSHQALQSRWVNRELNAFFMIAMSSGKPIVPCRLDDSDPPALLADIKYADFRDDFTVGMTALLGAVGIAEEISASRIAEDLAETVGASLNADERRRCYRTWIKQEMTPDWLLMIDMQERFGVDRPETPRGVKDLLAKSGLIEQVKQEPNPFKAIGDAPPPTKYTWAATPMGRRVFMVWAAEPGGST